MHPTVISFYTKNTGYEKEAANLIASLKKFQLDYEIDEIDSLGSWEKNCCYKPLFILEKLEKLQTPVLWVDADAIFMQKPTLFDSFPYDFGVYIVKHLPDSAPSKVISGTVYANYTNAAKKLLKAWSAECIRMLNAQERKEVWDQIALRNIILKNDEKAAIHPLSKEYYAVYDKIQNEETLQKAIILHYQASRILKPVVNGEVACFWDLSGLMPEELRQMRDHFARSISFPP